MYRCKDPVCDPICDFCWYCMHGESGEPIRCAKNHLDFDDGIGYCDDFICSLHEPQPDELGLNNENNGITI